MNYLDKQHRIVEYFNKLKKINKLSHAYIFETENYEEGLDIAKYFCSLLLCQEETPCLKCDICNRINNNQHPNINIIEPINNTIRKEQIVDLIEDFTSSAIEDGSLIYIINHSECLNNSSSNTLLKFLEEPIDNRYAIIITNNHSLLLDTIVSRAQLIRFENTEPIDIYNNYKEKGYGEELSFVLSNIKDNIEIEQDRVNTIYDIVCKLFKKIHSNKNIFTSFYTNLKDINDKSEIQLLIRMLIILSINFIRYLNNDNNKLINIYKDFKNYDINKEISFIDIYNKYLERLNTYTNVSLQISSMFIEIEKEACNG